MSERGHTDALDELKRVIDEIKAMPLPVPIRSIHIHPDDTAWFTERANKRNLPAYARISIGERDERGYQSKRPASWMVDGIPVYTSRIVPRGRPYIDPPEAAAGLACREHEDCRAVPELGRACSAAARSGHQVTDRRNGEGPER